MKDKHTFGGQAVIEGVMMKSPNYYSVAVRKPDNSITVRLEEDKSILHKYKIFKLPFFRGIASLFHMLVIGTKALTYSAEEALEDGKKESRNLSTLTLISTIIFSLAFAIALFVILPYYLTHIIGLKEDTQTFIFNLVDGAIKLLIFILYIIVIGFMHDIKRVFQYHGAEHKAINCYEANKKLNVKNVQSFSTLNPRCGTSFLVFVIMLGILLLSLIPSLILLIYPNFFDLPLLLNRMILLASRILFLLPIAGVSYEFLKFTARYRKNIFMKLFILPGYGIQLLTTKEPDNDQVEVGIKALNVVIEKEKHKH